MLDAAERRGVSFSTVYTWVKRGDVAFRGVPMEVLMADVEARPLRKMRKQLRIRRVRKKLGKSLRELGRRLDCDYTHLGRIERGEAEPSVELAERIAKALGQQFDEFFPEPRVCLCGKCGQLTFKSYCVGHYRPTPRQKSNAERFQQNLKLAKRIDAQTLADRAGCGKAFVARNAKRLGGQRYRGRWDGPRVPWTFPDTKDVVALVRAFLIESRAARNAKFSQTMIANYRNGKCRQPGRPREGKVFTCPVTKEEIYRHPGNRYAKHFASSAAVMQYRWDHRYTKWANLGPCIEGAFPEDSPIRVAYDNRIEASKKLKENLEDPTKTKGARFAQIIGSQAKALVEANPELTKIRETKRRSALLHALMHVRKRTDALYADAEKKTPRMRSDPKYREERATLDRALARFMRDFPCPELEPFAKRIRADSARIGS